ncbi:GNAT family N-acetyltransferase [Methylobacterium sp. HMF5984]|uniref:GNAT family N-acetyltransferase n=1 Tax=Methylobacterium sp. HMF5984 TaxID=3367370 RepID=UPI003853B25E
MARAGAQSGLTAEVFTDLDAVEALWRGLEADPACLATPYQRFAWVRAYAGAAAAPGALRIVVLRDAAGRPRILLPLAVERRRGIAIARTLGGDHANYHLPLFAARDAAAVPAEDVIAALGLVGRAAGIDVYALGHQPRTWDGAVNPLAIRGEAAPSDGYGMMLGPDPESTLKRAFSADARKKLRSKEKRLVEAHGALAYRKAADGAEAARFLSAFYAQKAARFAAMGIADPYADPAIRAFLTAATAGENPAVEIHALMLEATGRVLATFGGAVDGARYSGMMTAFDADPEIARFSPGDLLLHHLVHDQAAQGRRAFDLGVGEARYKASVCDETIPLVEATLPVTLRGHAYGFVATRLTRLKRRIKRDPRLFALVRRLRRMKGG